MFGNVVVVARFTTSRQARSCQMTLTTLFNTIARKVDDLFKKGDGQADLGELAEIYAQYGFRNENGWEQEHPVMVHENEVAWPLSFGVRRSDVEDLLQAMEPQSIEFHDFQEPIEEWQLYPLPEMIAFMDELDELADDHMPEDDEYLGNPPKRVIH
ncbi:MAG: hypothetical protein JXR76_17175 [Deltaproteobacteria bacterium]|nr:hypothetical protein [Deltaproteobacteria bacterium]